MFQRRPPQPPPPPIAPPPPPFLERDVELELLAEQLRRMRSMLFGYSERFFERIRTWGLVSIGLLVASAWPPLRPAVAFVPFLVPFAFLETGYLFFYTVFARRHAERLEQAINARLGRDVLAAHRLEAAYFYPPRAPKLAALSLGRPGGFATLMTAGYTVAALLLWIAGLAGTADWVAESGVGGLAPLLVPGALVWTGAVIVVLAWVFLGRRDERRLEAELGASYLPPSD